MRVTVEQPVETWRDFPPEARMLGQSTANTRTNGRSSKDSL